MATREPFLSAAYALPKRDGFGYLIIGRLRGRIVVVNALSLLSLKKRFVLLRIGLDSLRLFSPTIHHRPSTIQLSPCVLILDLQLIARLGWKIN